MLRHPLAIALVLALAPFAAQADDLMQSYQNARNSDPQFAQAESARLISAERPVIARSVLLPHISGSIGTTRYSNGSGNGRTGSWGLNLSQTLFD